MSTITIRYKGFEYVLCAVAAIEDDACVDGTRCLCLDELDHDDAETEWMSSNNCSGCRRILQKQPVTKR